MQSKKYSKGQTIFVFSLILVTISCQYYDYPKKINVEQVLGRLGQYPTDDSSNIQKPSERRCYQNQDVGTTARLIEQEQTSNEINSFQTPPIPRVNTYNLATLVFNAQKYFGSYCKRCKKLEYFAFRVGNSYLTAFATNLQLQPSGSPTNSQLFIAQQQVDGTWAFKSLTQGKYIRASNNGFTIDYQTFIGPWQRWYIERHGNHVHIQSAQFIYHWWIFSGGLLQQFNGGASALIVQHWPKLQWLWNW